MLKLRRSYEDFDGNKREEDFYFNLTKQELSKMQFGVNGGLDKMLQKVIDTQDTKEIINVFENIIQASYGVKSPDGRTFKKSPELLADFVSTPVYSDIYMELLTDYKKAVAFIQGIVPKDVAEAASKRQAEIEPTTAVTIEPEA